MLKRLWFNFDMLSPYKRMSDIASYTIKQFGALSFGRSQALRYSFYDFGAEFRDFVIPQRFLYVRGSADYRSLL